MGEEEAKKLAEKHWVWVKSLIDKQREMEEKLFIDAFMHGAKHEREANAPK